MLGSLLSSRVMDVVIWASAVLCCHVKQPWMRAMGQPDSTWFMVSSFLLVTRLGLNLTQPDEVFFGAKCVKYRVDKELCNSSWQVDGASFPYEINIMYVPYHVCPISCMSHILLNSPYISNSLKWFQWTLWRWSWTSLFTSCLAYSSNKERQECTTCSIKLHLTSGQIVCVTM